MKDLAATSAAAGDGLFIPSPKCPGVKKFTGLMSRVVSRSPQRFDPGFVELLEHNLHLCSARTESRAEEARIPVMDTVGAKEVISDCFYLFSSFLYIIQISFRSKLLMQKGKRLPLKLPQIGNPPSSTSF